MNVTNQIQIDDTDSEQEDDDIIIDNNKYNNNESSYTTDSEMPSLFTDESDQHWDDACNVCSDNECDQFVNVNQSDILSENNLRFLNGSDFKVRANRVTTLPDNFESSDKFTPSLQSQTNNHEGNGTTNNDGNDNVHYVNNLFNNEREIIIITGNDNPNSTSILFSNAIYAIENDNCVLYGQNEYQHDKLEDIYYKDSKVIRSRNSQWYIHVPINQQDGSVEKTWIFADPGANTPCVKTEWALRTFPNMISINKILKVMLTPGGPIKPKYSLWMSFPAKKNTTLKVKMNLVNDLPVDILADINMLEAFGYVFRDETPPIFRHDEKPDIQFDLKEDDEFISNRKESNWFNCVTQMKLNQIKHGNLQGDDSDKIGIVDRIYGDNGNIIYDSRIKRSSYSNTIVSEKEFDKEDKSNSSNDTIVNMTRIDENKEIEVEVDCNKYDINDIITELNEDKIDNSNCKIWKKCLMLTSKESFLATDEEKEKAEKVFKNEKLKFPDYSYLKSYERKYGEKYKNLYSEVMKWKEKYIKIFATHTFSRKTMYTPPAKLGIKPEHRDKIMYCPQYPISTEKRIHMINYTLINEKNGFWYKIPRSKHGIPYLMVPKRNSKGTIVRYRPAFDARIVNQYCELMKCVMPTFQDFRSLHQKRGLTTLADIKNFFDCIPLYWKDRKYAICFTPIGIYCMMCMTYGFMNAAPEAQKRTNDLAYHVGNALAYVDDIQIKHLMEDGTEGVIEALTRLGDYCIDKNIQLNPKKFYPATDESESFGFKNTLIGQMISDTYKRKLLAVAKPTTKAEMRSFDGLCNYVNNHIYCNKRIFYWLNRLKEETDPETKRTRLKWNKEANLAWEQLQYLFNHLPILHHPKKDGQFCLIVDACNYGIGASLYQDHSILEGSEPDWKLIDLWSKVMPTQLRHCHSMIHEAYSVVAACEHWQFFLIRNRFILATDNIAVARIFGESWKDLSPISQKQIIRIRSKLNSFTFETRHLPGIKNDLADGLSRFTVELIKTNKGKSNNPYPLELRAIESDDTMTPLLTAKEKEEFNLVKKECQMLTDRYSNLKKSKARHLISMIGDSYFVEPIDIKLYQPRKDKNSNQTIMVNKIFDDKIDDGFYSMLHEYKNNGNYLEREKLSQFIENEKEYLIRKEENQISNDELDSMINSICNVLHISNELLDDDCEKLEETLSNEYWQHLIEMREISRSVNVTTRSMTRRMKEKEKEEMEDDDTIEDERKFSKLNVRFDVIRDQMQSHEDLMLKLFGRRNRINVLDFSKYREYQESDNIIAIAIRLFKQPNRSKWDQDDIDTLFDQDHQLYRKLMDELLLIENNILKCYVYNKQKDDYDKRIVVPSFLQGKLIDYAHHNLYLHHLSTKYTFAKLRRRFWWNGIYKDVQDFCRRCVSCQFVKGGPIKRSPLRERYRPLPRQHVFADILGPVYQRYYILVLVDYATGYSMLIPMEGCDAISIAHAIIDYWIRIFGCFQFLETDWGSGFTARLMKNLSTLLQYDHEIAEPRNHRSIGKVERVIGFLQAIINHYNLILDHELTDNEDSEAAWTRIKILLPFIQFGFNQRKMRITGISPNMAIFGTNLNDLTDVARMTHKLDEFSEDSNLDKRDFQLLREIKDNIEAMNEIADSNWKDVTKLSVESYNDKYNITPEKVIRNRENFKEKDQVLYFIGDKQVARYKWREKWSGPWLINKVLNDTSIIISDPRNGNQKRVSIDRIKKYKPIDYIDYKHLELYDDEYLEYQKELLNTLSNYNVRTMNKEWNLDYSKFDNSKSSIEIKEKENNEIT